MESSRVKAGMISNGARKILIFSLAYYPHRVSGAEAAIREITDRIDERDIEFHMLTLRFSSDDLRHEKIGSVHVHRVGIGPSYLSKILFIPLAVLESMRLCRTHSISALWPMLTYMLFPVALARLCGLRVPYVITLQDGDPYEKVFGRWFVRPFTPLLDYGFRRAAIVQVISHYLAEWPRRRGFKGPLEVIYNGADPNDFIESTDTSARDALARALGKKEGDVFLVNTARLEHQKAYDDVIRALPMLPDRVRLLIVGSGTLEGQLRNLVATLGLESRVVFAGQVEYANVTLYRKVADIFVAPSRSEGLGVAPLSAMASRLPVVSTREGGLAEFVFDEAHNPGVGQTAWVVDKDSPDGIAEAVRDILAHPEHAREVTSRAHRMVREKFNWDVVARDMRTKVFSVILGEKV